MLTMGKPVQPKSIRPMGTPGEMFGERIRTNYEQLQGRLNPVDILHFLSAPPELYLVKTGMTTLVNQQNTEAEQNLELSLVNNVLNRILVSERIAFTYQDRVFVENILKKLGVTDVREFIRRARMIKEEIGTVRELLALYESGRDTIRVIQEYSREYAEKQKRQETRDTGEEDGEPEAAWRLASAVLNRLRLGDIYRRINSHAVFRLGSRSVIDRRELSFGDRNIAVSYLTLNDFRSRILVQRQKSGYGWPDRYEAWNISRTDETFGQTVNNLVQTALLHAIAQLFHIRYTEFTRHTGLWHEFMDALHVSVRNTWQRFESISEGPSFAIQDGDEYHRTMQHFERQEISDLKNLFAAGAVLTAGVPRETETVQGLPQNPTTLVEMRQQDTNVAVVWQEAAALREHPPQEAERLRVEREEEIRKQLAHINRQNIERMERLAAYTSRTEESERLRIDRETAKADVIRALTGQERVISAYRERDTLHTAQTRRETETLREILGDETLRVFETIRGYRENPGQYPNVTTSQEQTGKLFLQDIAAAGEAQTAVLPEAQGVVGYNGVQRLSEKEQESALPGTVRSVRPGALKPVRTPGQTEQGMELLHRRSGQTISGERLQELMQTYSRDRMMQNTDVRETLREEKQVTEIVRSKVNEMKQMQDEEIARMISQNVKRQLDTLSEKVYGKLERRMDAERRRRGL